MSDALLCSDIERWLRENARGAENAKPRGRLMDHLISKSLLSPLAHIDRRVFDTEDRKMRRAYETMEFVGSCSRGLFWIVTAEDRRIAQSQLHGRAMAELVREKRIKDSAPCGQGELF